MVTANRYGKMENVRKEKDSDVLGHKGVLRLKEELLYEELDKAREVYDAYPLKTKKPSIKELRDMSGKKLRHATPEDYAAWLLGYLLKGGKPTHYYDYDMPRDEFYVAEEDFETAPLHGADSINIIVPGDVNWKGGELGHCNLYLMKDFKNIGGDVPVYKDVVEIIGEYVEKIKKDNFFYLISSSYPESVEKAYQRLLDFVKLEKKRLERFERRELYDMFRNF
jgi:hypothetical protein